jgi:hypothetical protein
MDHTKTAIPRM